MENIKFSIWKDGAVVRAVVPATSRFARCAVGLNGRRSGSSWEFPCESEAAVRQLVLKCFGWVEGTSLVSVRVTFEREHRCRAGALCRMGRELAVCSDAGASAGAGVSVASGLLAATYLGDRAELVISPGSVLIVHEVPRPLAETYARRCRGGARYELFDSGAIVEGTAGSASKLEFKRRRKKYITRSLALLLVPSEGT